MARFGEKGGEKEGSNCWSLDVVGHEKKRRATNQPLEVFWKEGDRLHFFACEVRVRGEGGPISDIATAKGKKEGENDSVYRACPPVKRRGNFGYQYLTLSSECAEGGEKKGEKERGWAESHLIDSLPRRGEKKGGLKRGGPVLCFSSY